jgi:hypothetical protein
MLVADYRAQSSEAITVVNLTEPPARLDPSPAHGVAPVSTPEPAANQEP